MKTPIGLTGNPLWKRDTQHGDLWLQAYVTIPKSTSIPSYRIAFEAIVGKGYKGDVAIDEIVFTPNKRCSPVSQFGDTVGHYCDFEIGVCGYTQNELSGKWNRIQPTSSDEPTVDNTYQTRNGYYMAYKNTVNKKIYYL